NSTISKQVEGICLYDTTSLWINIDSLFPTPLNYYWSTGETTDTILVNPNIDTEYTLYYSDSKCGNIGVDSEVIKVDTEPPPIAFAGYDSVVCIFDSIMLEGEGGIDFLWNNPLTLDNPNISNPYANPDSTTSYVLTVFNEYCFGTDTVEIIVDLCLEELPFSIPQIITPNGDGANDNWQIENIDYFTESSLVIYNRWWNKVYEANPYLNDWQGQSLRDADLPDGTYYYILDIGNGLLPYKGYVIIHR
ncbi:MAG: gliding motility-associated C-terminal domain-containing protein, partial [Bacteroidales bacterium]|nr:gliding motility-associated C-terminal domain-containing protein [Bacteroidales bacterium]